MTIDDVIERRARMVLEGYSFEDIIKSITTELDCSYESFTTNSEESNKELTIEQLKRNIKYYKNPMELKTLNRLLNQRYKERKKCNENGKDNR